MGPHVHGCYVKWTIIAITAMPDMDLRWQHVFARNRCNAAAQSSTGIFSSAQRPSTPSTLSWFLELGTVLAYLLLADVAQPTWRSKMSSVHRFCVTCRSKML